MAKNIPTKSKLTLKGDTPEKVASKGIDPATLENYTMPLEADIAKLSAEIGKACVAWIAKQESSKGVSYAELFDAKNGKGYMANLEKRIAKDVAEIALGTAPQTRAYKDTLCSTGVTDKNGNLIKLEPSDLVSTKGKSGGSTVVVNDFA